MKQLKPKVLLFADEQSWLDARRGKITGTRLADIVPKRGGGYKKGFYEIIAERVAIPRDDENRMDRGKRLEEEAIERFEHETGKKVNKDLVLIHSASNENIAYSPDGYIEKKGVIEETVEVKCLNSAAHIEAWMTKKVPSEYEEQYIQPFITLPSLKRLFFAFFDPSMPLHDFFYFTIERKDVQERIDELEALELSALEEIKRIQAEFTL